MSLSLSDMMQHLRTIPLFQPLEQDAIERLLQSVMLQKFAAGEHLYRSRDFGNSMFVLVEGQVALSVTRRGDTQEINLDNLLPIAAFGEDAVLGDGRRAHSARAVTDVAVLELGRSPIQLQFAKSANHAHFLKAKEQHRRQALLDRLRQSSFLKDLPEKEILSLSERARLRTYHRGEFVYEVGDVADQFYIIGEGTVRVGRRVGNMEHIRAYLTAGDFFGDLELLTRDRLRQVRPTSVTAMSTLELIELPAEVFLDLNKRYPKLGAELRRVTREAGLLLQELEHLDVLNISYQAAVAQSLLLIDLNQCVRCGNCAWSCDQTHGNSRLVRRGETIQSPKLDQKTPTSLLLPNSCQHCTDAECMTGCPTGAIARDIDGEVFVHDQACIGCGSCAKRCPWGNIKMISLPDGAEHKAKAVKCDNCRNYSVSACVHNCPTGAIRRGDPVHYIPELEKILNRKAVAPIPPSLAARLIALFAAFLVCAGVLGALGYGLRHPAELHGGSKFGLTCGIAGLILMFAAALFSARKRFIRYIMKLNPKRASSEAVSSGNRLQKSQTPLTLDLRHWMVVHVLAGGGAFVLILLHAGFFPKALLTGLLFATFSLVVATGFFGGWAYKVLPRLLTTIEGTPMLLEDLDDQQLGVRAEQDELIQNRSAQFMAVANRMQQDVAGWSWLAQIYRRRMREAEFVRKVGERYRDELQRFVQEDRLALERVLDGYCRERHLAAQRLLHRTLRVWLVPHILACVAMALLLGIHLLQVGYY